MLMLPLLCIGEVSLCIGELVNPQTGFVLVVKRNVFGFAGN